MNIRSITFFTNPGWPLHTEALQGAADFIRAGAAAVAVGSSLVNKKLIASGDFDALTRTASGLVAGVRQARGQ